MYGPSNQFGIPLDNVQPQSRSLNVQCIVAAEEGTEQVLLVDSFNPMTAARLIEPLSRFRFYAQPWSDLMKDALQTIAKAPNLSKNVAELATKALEG